MGVTSRMITLIDNYSTGLFNQRALRKRGLLNLDRTKKLDGITFVWNAVDAYGKKVLRS
jgi:hypothetical protein